MALTGATILLIGIASGFAGWFMWALSLNGFAGQQRAVDVSLVVYVVLAVVSTLICVVLSVLTVYILSGRFNWNVVGSAVLSIVVFVVTTGVLNTISVVISAIVASELRTNK